MKPEQAPQGTGHYPAKVRAAQGSPAPATVRPDRLQKHIDQFCETLLATFAPRVEKQAKGFKRRVLAMVAKRLPPFRKSPGRPRLRYVTLAAKAYEVQVEEVKDCRRKKIDWRKIALDCEPTFGSIRSDNKRRAVLKRLRDAVHARMRKAER